MNKKHNQAVNEFMRSCQRKDPQRYEEVCERYPVLSSYQWRRVREQEIPFASLSPEEISELGLDSTPTNDE